MQILKVTKDKSVNFVMSVRYVVMYIYINIWLPDIRGIVPTNVILSSRKMVLLRK